PAKPGQPSSQQPAYRPTGSAPVPTYLSRSKSSPVCALPSHQTQAHPSRRPQSSSPPACPEPCHTAALQTASQSPAAVCSPTSSHPSRAFHPPSPADQAVCRSPPSPRHSSPESPQPQQAEASLPDVPPQRQA